MTVLPQHVGVFFTLTEAKVLIERWRREYNTIRPHSSLGYRSPAPAAIMSVDACSAALRTRQLAREHVVDLT
jgi:transposase InsO family protein